MTPRRPLEIRRRAFLGATALLLAAACTVRMEPSGRLRLSAGQQGGLYLAFAELLADRVHARYPSIDVDVVSTEGSVDNIGLLRRGEVDMGLSLADVAERDRGTGESGDAPLAVARVYENYLQVIVPNSVAAEQLSDLRGKRISVGALGTGAAVTGQVLLDAAGLTGQVDIRGYRLQDGLTGLADGSLDAMMWSGGVPTPAIAELDATLPLRMLDVGPLAKPMAERSGYPYLARRVPSGEYVPPGIRTIGVPDLLLCRQDTPAALVAAVVDVLVAEAPQLIPPRVRGLQYLAPPTMIQTGRIPLHGAAIGVYRKLHG